MFKKILLGILAANSIAVFAEPHHPGDSATPPVLAVNVPCINSGWELGAQALYFQSIYGSPSMGQFGADNRVAGTNAAWGWGYRLNGAYRLPAAKKIDLNWVHFNNTTKPNGLSRTSLTGNGLLPFTALNNLYFDQVNLTLQQEIDVPLNTRLSFYAGGQFAQLHLNLQNHYSRLPLPLSVLSPTGLLYNVNTDTNGAGPLLGLDYRYQLPCGLSLEAQGQSSILYGTSRYGSEYILAANGLVATSSYRSSTNLIPSLEGKLGLNYLYALADSSINIEGGYQIINYFNLPGLGWPYEQILPGNVNFALQGAYMGAKWVGYF